ncbi:MAG: alpha/beta hydrolase [Arenicella sp.]|nr:alpha/beta hydrolase [Arenicella sp.]
MPEYTHVWYNSQDGLKLYARDYQSAGADENAKPTLLCMHGLTRNSADFEGICQHLADKYRLIVVDQRGRGLSAYDSEPANYQPKVYVEDMFALLKHLNISSVTLMGTSMGGIMAMIMAAMRPELIKGLIINDIGPELNPVGLARIQSYVGKGLPVSTWQDATQQCKQTNGSAFPDFSQQDWLEFSQRTYRADQSGKPVLDYDPAISSPIKASKGQSLSLDLWPVFEQSIDKPMLLLRGELSDLLAMSCVTKMHSLKADLSFVQVPNVGHAPLLDEAIAVTAIKQFLQTIG